MGKLIVFEGTDGSGKSTQFSLLTRRLEARGVDFRTMVFPQYTDVSRRRVRRASLGRQRLHGLDLLCRRSLCGLPQGLGRVLPERRPDALRPLYDLKRRPSGLEGAGAGPREVFCVAL